MQTQFVREGMNNYLVINDIELWDNEYEINLFRNQNIPCFMACELRDVNGKAQLYYKLQYRTSLKEAFGHISFTAEKINNIMRSIVKALEVCEEYLLLPDNIICTPDKVFMEVNTGKLLFGYCPGTSGDVGSLHELVMEILQNIDRRYEKGAIDLLQFYNLLTEADCSIEGLKNVTVYGGRCNRVDVYEDDRKGEEEGDNKLIVSNDNRERNQIINKKEARCTEQSNSVVGETPNINNKINRRNRIIQMIVKTGMALTAAVDILLLAGLIFNVLTYEKTGFLFVGMAVLIILVIIYMQMEPCESPDEMMESYMKEQEGENIRIHDQYGNDGSGDQYLYAQDERGDIDKNKYVGGFHDSIGASGKAVIPMNNVQGGDIDGETVLLTREMEDKTQLVKEDSPGGLYLIPVEGDRCNSFSIEKSSLVVGSMRGSCDYVISARGVSRLHAKLSNKADGVYVMDMNSTNGTYLNGELLAPGKEYKMEIGDMVSFAKVQYIISEKNAT